MVNREKKLIWKGEETLSFYGTLAVDVIKELQSYIDKYGAENVRVDNDYFYSYDDNKYNVIEIQRLETDVEYNTRVAMEVEYEQKREEQERKQFEALKAKYGNGS